MTDDPATHATTVARTLRDSGHVQACDHLETTVTRHRGGALLEALREACQYLLTGFEVLDPGAFAAIEELRLDVDRRLDTGHTSS